MQSRGPTAQRGLQFLRTAKPELLDSLLRTRARLQLIEGIDRSPSVGGDGIAELRGLSKSELAALRKELLDLQTDLRAELRRRVEV
jgi:hypothetical protein